MTRSKLRRTLSRTYWILGLVLVVSLGAKLADSIPGIAGTKAAQPLKDAYEYMKDMSLVFVTVVAAYLANVFQSRSSFIASLREEWRDIITSKSMLFAYTQIERPTQAQYLETFCRLSETIDNMRTVYRNVGETDALIGLYPYSPLHDMRRALQTLEPGPDRAITAEQRRLVRDESGRLGRHEDLAVVGVLHRAGEGGAAREVLRAVRPDVGHLRHLDDRPLHVGALLPDVAVDGIDGAGAHQERSKGRDRRRRAPHAAALRDWIEAATTATACCATARTRHRRGEGR